MSELHELVRVTEMEYPTLEALEEMLRLDTVAGDVWVKIMTLRYLALIAEKLEYLCETTEEVRQRDLLKRKVKNG